MTNLSTYLSYLKQDPTNPNLYEASIHLLLLNLSEGKVSEYQVQTLLKIRPEDARLWFSLGTIQARALKFQSAEEAFLKAKDLDRMFADNWISLGWCQLFLDKLDAAEQSYLQTITIDKNSAEGLGGLAIVKALQTRIEEAELFIAKSKAIDNQCFFANIANIILAIPQDIPTAGEQFNDTFSTLSEDLKNAINVILTARATTHQENV